MFSYVKYLALFTLLLAQSACATLGGHLSGELSGVVIDKATGEPIEGAIVVAQWQGDGFHPVDSRTVCFHVESATTDQDGKFNITAIPPTPVAVMNASAYVAGVYKEGYREVSYKDTKEPGFKKAPRGVVHLIPFTGSREERFEYLKRVRVGCSGAGKGEKSLFKFHKEIYEEMKRLAVTGKEIKYVSGYRRLVAGLAVSTDGQMTSREYESLIDQYLKNHPL